MKMYRIKLLGLSIALLTLLFSGCSSSSNNTAHVTIGQGCDPISTDDCFLPYPSFYYLTQDSSTATGWRVNYPDGVLPVNSKGIALNPAPFNTEDGFSPASQILVYFAQGVTPTSLPSQDNLAASTLTSSPIQVINFSTGTRVPLFAEVDANALPGERQALIIRPMIRLNTSSHYVVVILNTVKDRDGNPLRAPVPFVYLRDRIPTDNSVVESIRAHYEQLFSFLTSEGINRNDIVLAWDFTTASDQFLTSHLITMRNKALSLTQTVGMSYTFTTINTFTPASASGSYNPFLYKELIGTFSAPTFLNASGYLVTNSVTGLPEYVGQAGYPIVVHIPACITSTTLPIPIMIYGHGLFGSAQGEMETHYQERLINQLCMVQIGTDWIGLSSNDIGNASIAIADFNKLPLITDKLQQAQINVVVMTKLALSYAFQHDPALEYNNQPIMGNEIYYYGISDGGIQGATFMSIDPDIKKGVLGVPGSTWSLMIQRNPSYNMLELFFSPAYPDELDRMKLLSLSQYDWDFADPITFAPHTIMDPLPGTPQKQILIQAGINDSEVPNIATNLLARTMGLPGLKPLPVPVYGITETTGPLPSALTYWTNLSYNGQACTYIPPSTNEPPSTDSTLTSCVHEAVRRLPQVIEQIGLFLTPTGQVEQTCFASQGCFYTGTTQ
ncbi:MAG: hypothetical protein ACP5QW_09635 [bacterium]